MAPNRIVLAWVDDAGDEVVRKEHGPIAGWVPLSQANDRILWAYTNGAISLWKIDDAGNQVSYKEHGPFPGWTPLGYADGKILWRNSAGGISLWFVDDAGNQLRYKEYAAIGGWTPICCGDDKVLWRSTDNRISLWRVDSQGNQVSYKEYGPFAGWVPLLYAKGRILWRNANNAVSIWQVDAQGNQTSYKEHGPIAGWTPYHIAEDRLYWRHTNGTISVWYLDALGNQVRYREYGPFTGDSVFVAEKTSSTNLAMVGFTPKIAITFPVGGAIAVAYNASGGKSGPLGSPSTAAALALDGETTYQGFDGGGITTHPILGTTLVTSSKVFGPWRDQAAVLGPPIRPNTNIDSLDCERGTLWRSMTGYYVPVLGLTAHCYSSRGGAAGEAGYPLGAREAQANGIWRQSFQQAEIWEYASQAFFLARVVADVYAANGGRTGALGLPMSSTLAVDGGTVTRFEKGVIVWTAEGGAVAVFPPWLAQWETLLGGPKGKHGLPISAEKSSPGGTHWMDFQHGCLIRRPNGEWIAPLSINVKATHFSAFGDDGAAGEQDLYVIANLSASTGQTFSRRLYDGEWPPDVAVNMDLLQVPVVRGDLVLDIAFEGWDSDVGNIGGGPDDRLGGIRHKFTIDDLWGRDSLGMHRDSDFAVEYAVQLELVFDPGKFREAFAWRYRNFGTDDVTYEQFARAYADVDTDETVGWHVFHHIFYEAAIRNCAEAGNCFGMCLESIYAQLGRSLFKPPLNQYGPAGQKPTLPTDSALMDQINVRHTYQVGAKQALYYMENSVAQNEIDGNALFYLSKAMHERGQHPLIYVYSNSMFDDGHVVRPYAWAPDGSYIRIANPNAPSPLYGDDHAANTIVINKTTGHWTLNQGTIYTNNSALADVGRIAVVPSTYLLEEPETPSLVDFMMLGAFWLALKFGNASIEQVTDSAGRKLFVEGLSESPSKWEHLVTGSGRIPGVVPMPMLGGGPLVTGFEIPIALRKRRPAMLLGRASLGRLDYRLRGTGGATTFAHVSGRLGLHCAYQSVSDQSDLISVDMRGTDGAGVRFQAGGSINADLTFGIGRNVWRARGVALGAGAPLEVTMRERAESLIFRSQNVPVTLDLDRFVNNQFVACGARSDVSLSANQELEINLVGQSGTLFDRGTRNVIRKFSF